MSNRKREAHRQKMDERRRIYPLLEQEDLNARLEILSLTARFIGDALIELGNPHTAIPEDQRAMRGAHLTIAHYIMERLAAEYQHDLEIIARTADIQKLIDLRGKPIA